MGAGEYLSSRSYNNYVRTELARETWELENYPRGEITEMIDLFEKRGMSREDAEVVIMRMAKYKEFFLNLMMTEELSLPVPTDSDDADSLRDGFIMFASFDCFGMVPIIGYACTPLVFPGLEQHNLFEIACAITAFTLFGLGVFKAFFNDKRYFMAGLETTVLGGVCAAVAFGVGSTSELAATDVAVVDGPEGAYVTATLPPYPWAASFSRADVSITDGLGRSAVLFAAFEYSPGWRPYAATAVALLAFVVLATRALPAFIRAGCEAPKEVSDDPKVLV